VMEPAGNRLREGMPQTCGQLGIASVGVEGSGPSLRVRSKLRNASNLGHGTLPQPQIQSQQRYPLDAVKDITMATPSCGRVGLIKDCPKLQRSMSQFFRSRMGRTLATVVGLCLFYLLGVFARQHSGVRVVIRNERREPVQELSVEVENKGNRHNLQDLVPGDHERAFVQPVEQSRIVLEFADAGHKSRTITVFDRGESGGCEGSTVRFLPPRNTETVETHEAVCWKSWLDFL
jgi:hypothetical protein